MIIRIDNLKITTKPSPKQGSGANVARKVFRKLNTGVTTTTSSITQLQVIRLTIGRSYKAALQWLIQGSGAGGSVYISHNGVRLSRGAMDPDSSLYGFVSATSVVEFVAETTTLEVEASLNAGASLFAHSVPGGREGTYIEVTELPYDINAVDEF